MASTLIIGSVVIAVIELVLWVLFRRQIAGISFPRDTDQSFFRFFTMARIAAVCFTHTFVLILGFILMITALW